MEIAALGGNPSDVPGKFDTFILDETLQAEAWVLEWYIDVAVTFVSKTIGLRPVNV